MPGHRSRPIAGSPRHAAEAALPVRLRPADWNDGRGIGTFKNPDIKMAAFFNGNALSDKRISICSMKIIPAQRRQL
jgi:hypothetical protein